MPGETDPFLESLAQVRASGLPYVVLAAARICWWPTRDITASSSRFAATASRWRATIVTVESGAELQALVDFTIERGRANLQP
jgi:hypothetical protein